MDTMVFIERIAERVTKEVRHMEVIAHDPEGQRIKRLIVGACQESFALALPKDDGRTHHVTTEKDVQFKITGVEAKSAKTLPPANVAVPEVVCKTCDSLHDPRQQYDHAAT